MAPDQYPEELKRYFRKKTGRALDLEHPRTLNEKIQWMKLYDSTPLKTRLADKYLVREWIAEKIGSEYLVPLLGVWDRFDDIDFAALPDQFVLKTNHGSGWNLIVRDKSRLDKAKAKKKFDKWMRTNFAFQGLELHYLNIPPKIIAEKYIKEAEQGMVYRFMCIHGRLEFIWVETDNDTKEPRRTFFDRNWQKIDVCWKGKKNAPYEIAKPFNFEKMKRFSEILSRDFVLVRVDFYEMGETLYFSEMTFTSASGTRLLDPEEYDYKWGSLIQLPPKSRIPVRNA